MRQKGFIRRWNEDRGYGFVDRDSLDPPISSNVFLHIKDLQVSGRVYVLEGVEVEFDLKETPKGPKAENAKLTGGMKDDN